MSTEIEPVNLAARPVVTPRLRRLLVAVFLLMSLLIVDSVYLSAVSFYQWANSHFIEDSFYQWMFLLHLILGVLVIVPALIFMLQHLRRALSRPNRIAVRIGISLFIVVLVLLITGIALTRGLPVFELKHELTRDITYWLHVIAPVAAIWLFVLHRLVGPRIRWRTGLFVGITSLSVAGLGLLVLQLDLEESVQAADFSPSLSKTVHGGYIAPKELMTNDYCMACHEDVHDSWSVSAHRFASFNNPAYAFSVNNTRSKVLERDGDVSASRFCASCHDPVPLFSGLFDDPNIDFETHITGQAGITCVACHAIQEVNGVRGNGEYTIGIPEPYPFTDSQGAVASWVNGLLIKGRPQLHKVSYLKPFHQTAEFCSTCHKVHIPEQLNHYKWLRGQNHYDSFLVSGISGHGLSSFYYPETAQANCNGCHMPTQVSTDFGAKFDTETEELVIHSHQFPAANTALQYLKELPPVVNEAHVELLKDSLRVDIFGIYQGGDITSPFMAPLRPDLPELETGQSYVFAIVLRNLKVGHHFTEGTIDSNEVWLKVVATTGEANELGSSGKLDETTKAVGEAHFVNGYVIDREGNRIDRRNAEDIFIKLYDHQLGPGGASVAFYRLTIPEEISESEVHITAKLNYRKFDQRYFELFTATPGITNDLPIVNIASDSLVVGIGQPSSEMQAVDTSSWERWNDFGIAMLLKPKRSGLRHAEEAFKQVSSLGRPEGALNLARLYLKEGRLEDAVDSLTQAGKEGAYPWSVAWFGAQIDVQLGNFDAAVVKMQQLYQSQFEEARARGFDFSRDYNLTNLLGLTYFEQSKLDRQTDQQRAAKSLEKAVDAYQKSLVQDPENVTAHYGLTQVYAALGDEVSSDRHRKLHGKYRVDDNAKDRAISLARLKDPLANKASESIVIYDLQKS